MLAIGAYTLHQTRQDYFVARPRLLDKLRGVIRRKNCSIRTEIAYVDWVRRFVHFCDLKHPRECGALELERFLTHLAIEGRVTGSTQNQARSALLFFYMEVLGIAAGIDETCGAREARHTAYAASFIRHAPARQRLGHSHRAGTARA